LVLLDIMMPGLSGTDVLKTVRETHSLSDLPIIMATAKDGNEDILASLRMGANDYVTKPLDFAIVHARVEVQLAYKRAKDEAQRLASDLSAANARLEEVQHKIVELQKGATGTYHGMAAWAHSMADGIARLVGVAEIAVFSMDESGVTLLSGSSPRLPTLQDLESARGGPRERATKNGVETLLAILGPQGELHGGVVVPARITAWGNSEQRLLESFARNLGTALDLQSVRSKLAKAEQRQAASRKEMLDRGLQVLQICPTCGRCYHEQPSLCEDDASPLKSPQLLPYRIQSRYRLVHLIGEGGMGMVFSAYDERLGRNAALKILRPEAFKSEDGRTRFEREAQALAGIDHPGVIRVFDSGELDDGSPYMVMELVEGMTLKSVLESEGRGTCRQVATLVRQGAAALEAAHAVGLVHRDIKPENFICIPAGTSFLVKLLDFGIAKSMAVDGGVTQAGMVLGTPRYMSPEQVKGKPVDARSDLYSFATVAYEALTGAAGVAERTELGAILLEVALTSPPPLSERIPWIPAEVDEAFMKGLSKEPEDRPAGLQAWADSFVSALERLPAVGRGWDIGLLNPALSRSSDATAAHPRDWDRNTLG
ncbi:MAG: protein kinase, partial [Thermoanaerobaculia bacterium]